MRVRDRSEDFDSLDMIEGCRDDDGVEWTVFYESREGLVDGEWVAASPSSVLYLRGDS